MALKWRRQVSMTTFAFARDRTHSTLRHSSRSLPLTLSSLAFCQGLPGSIKAVPMPAWASHSRTARLTNSGPLSERRKVSARATHLDEACRRRSGTVMRGAQRRCGGATGVRWAVVNLVDEHVFGPRHTCWFATLAR